MPIVATRTPGDPWWRSRVVDDAGEVIAESRGRYPSIGAAVAQGRTS